ncbi:MAG: hypothetical protein BRC58_11355 [Cyanobacteria bacterium QS_8_64_29]|nr:MAG: hypothetical protein BRC58_11355 [Cyanobacteria bacterium QS_8_64_29]
MSAGSAISPPAVWDTCNGGILSSDYAERLIAAPSAIVSRWHCCNRCGLRVSKAYNLHWQDLAPRDCGS